MNYMCLKAIINVYSSLDHKEYMKIEDEPSPKNCIAIWFEAEDSKVHWLFDRFQIPWLLRPTVAKVRTKALGLAHWVLWTFANRSMRFMAFIWSTYLRPQFEYCGPMYFPTT